MEKYSINVTLDMESDINIINFFKEYKGKKVDALRCLADGYFSSKTSLTDEQKKEVETMIKKYLSMMSLNINTDSININGNISESYNKKEEYQDNYTDNQDDDTIKKVIDNCGIDIKF